MAVVTNTFHTGSAVGNREDLMNMIYELPTDDTPFIDAIGREKARGVYTEWQTDEIGAATSNKQIEGDEASFSTVVPTVRVGNYQQILRKTFVISETQDVVDKAGRAKEVAYQLVLHGKRLKTDIEFAAVTNQASSAGGTATARSMAGAESWISDNRILGGASTTGTTPGFASGVVAAPTDGTATGAGSTISETNLLDALGAAWTDGGNASLVLCGTYQKRLIGGFTGVATKYNEVKGSNQATIIGAVDMYVSDYGNHSIVLDRHMRTRTVLCIDPEFWAMAYLRPIKQTKLAKTGDAEKRMLICETTLCAKNEKSSAKIQDLLVA